MSSSSSQFQLLCGILVYLVSSLGGIALVKLLNYRYCFTSWLWFALLSRSTWILSLGLHFGVHWWQQQRQDPSSLLHLSSDQFRIYLGIAITLSTVELLNSYSMSVLPGSLYMLLKGSDVGWSMALSFLVLNKRYSTPQVLAALLIMTGITLVFLLDDHRKDDDDNIIDNSDTNHTTTLMEEEGSPASSVSTVWMASLLCLSGAFLNALCTVATEKMLKQTLSRKAAEVSQEGHPTNQQPSKLLLSNAYSMWTSLFSFWLLALPIAITGMTREDSSGYNAGISSASDMHIHSNKTEETCNEMGTTDGFSSLTSKNFDDSENNSSITATITIVIGLCLALLGVSRFLERLCKHWICVCDSAMTFSVVQAARRMTGVYIIGLLFREHFSMGLLIGSICSGMGFVLKFWFRDDNNATRTTTTIQYQPLATHSSNATDDVPVLIRPNPNVASTNTIAVDGEYRSSTMLPRTSSDVEMTSR